MTDLTTTIDVEVDDPHWLDTVPDVEILVRTAVEAALEGRAVGEVVVLLTDDERVRTLNREFRSKDQATNVLSFPAHPSARPHLGDLALAYGVCCKEAPAQGKSVKNHLMHLTIHGVLHLLGYDHQSDPDAAAMQAIERSLLSEFGVADPYVLDETDAWS